MAIDVSGFLTPEQSWGGLYKLGENFRREKAESAESARKIEAGKAASAKFLTDYLDEKQFLTGTPNDPYIVGNVQKLLQEGAELIQKGVDNSQLLMALSPKVGQLSQKSQSLKQLAAQKKAASDLLAKNPAIDINKFNAEFDNIYFETDEMGNKTLRDISQLDPNKNYVDEILNTRQVYTPAGFDAFVGKAAAVTERQKVQTKDARGALSMREMELSAPEFMQPEFENGTFTRQFVPKYEIATNDQKPIISKFMTGEGRQVDAEVRLLDKNTFANLPKDAMAYVLQEAKQFASENQIPINDPRVELFSRALAYDALKNSAKQKTSAKEVSVQQAAPAPRITNNINTSGGDGIKGEMGTPYVDMYNSIKDKAKSAGQGKIGIAMTNLNGEEIAMVLDMYNKKKKEDDKMSQSNTYIRFDSGMGKLWLMDATKMPEAGQKIPSDAFLMEIPALINVKATTGAKGKQQAQKDIIAGDKQKSIPIFKNVPKGGF